MGFRQLDEKTKRRKDEKTKRRRDKKTKRQKGKKTKRQKDKKTKRQKDKKTKRQKDKKTKSCISAVARRVYCGSPLQITKRQKDKKLHFSSCSESLLRLAVANYKKTKRQKVAFQQLLGEFIAARRCKLQKD